MSLSTFAAIRMRGPNDARILGRVASDVFDNAIRRHGPWYAAVGEKEEPMIYITFALDTNAP